MRRPLAAAALAALAALPGCREDKVVAPSLALTCEARPASGTAPLPVFTKALPRSARPIRVRDDTAARATSAAMARRRRTTTTVSHWRT